MRYTDSIGPDRLRCMESRPAETVRNSWTLVFHGQPDHVAVKDEYRLAKETGSRFDGFFVEQAYLSLKNHLYNDWVRKRAIREHIPLPDFTRHGPDCVYGAFRFGAAVPEKKSRKQAPTSRPMQRDCPSRKGYFEVSSVPRSSSTSRMTSGPLTGWCLSWNGEAA